MADARSPEWSWPLPDLLTCSDFSQPLSSQYARRIALSDYNGLLILRGLQVLMIHTGAKP